MNEGLSFNLVILLNTTYKINKKNLKTGIKKTQILYRQNNLAKEMEI